MHAYVSKEITDLYEKASEITKYEILDDLLDCIAYTLALSSVGALVGKMAGGYELVGALSVASLIFAVTRLSNLAEKLRKNLESILKNYCGKD